MYARRNQLIETIKQIGLGMALVASPFLSGQTVAQTTSPQYNISDSAQRTLISPSTPTTTTTTATPIIKSVHQYALDAQGNLNGLISTGDTSPAGLDIFVTANRKIITQATTDRTGNFSIAGLAPGNYSIFVTGQNRFAAQGIAVTGPTQIGLTQSLELTTVKTKYTGFTQLLSQSLLPPIKQATNKPFQQVSSLISDTGVTKKVRIINGQVRGQISSLIAESNASGVQIHLIQNDEPIAQVETNSLGSFLLPEVEAGVYDFVAVGKAGFAAMRIEAIGSPNPMKMASYQQEVATSLEVPLAEDVVPANVDAANTDMAYMPGNELYMEPAYANAQSAPVEYAGESVACGCAGGAVSGSYGNFSNFGGGRMVGGRLGGRFGRFNGGLRGGTLGTTSGLGRLLTLGAVSGGIIAIADDNDSPPASPVSN